MHYKNKKKTKGEKWKEGAKKNKTKRIEKRIMADETHDGGEEERRGGKEPTKGREMSSITREEKWKKKVKQNKTKQRKEKRRMPDRTEERRGREGTEEGKGGVVNISRPRVIKGIVFYPKKGGLGPVLWVEVMEGGERVGRGGEGRNMGMGKGVWR